ncbi:hypothetical protein [Burkholderia sp. BCC1644]|uniref:hypothetical protein n=1 Tax=Burkholderia sp. BCC1644 TaxID=2676293 RepID=UPI001591F1AD|nr:hypothetical protein [Burkholderia sp. BCC1644]
MRIRTILAAVLGLTHAQFAIDPSEPAVDQVLAPAATDAAAAPASDAGESSGTASAAAAGPENDISSSAAPALLSGDIAAAGAPQGDAPEVAPSGESSAVPDAAESTPASATDSAVASPNPTENGAILDGADVVDPTPAVSIDVEDHAEARERFAGLLTQLHEREEDFVHALRNELNAIGVLLHLHTVASGKAETTGDYSSSDLS